MSQYWTWTQFNYHLENLEERIKNYKKKDRLYIVFGYELTKDGRPHLQGYFEFDHNIKKSTIAKEFRTMNLELTEGSGEDNRLYCLKARPQDKKPNEKFYESGTPTKEGRGKRNDLSLMAASILAGELTARQILRAKPNQFHQYGRTIQALEALYNEDKWRNWMTLGEWHYGVGGTFKTEDAFTNYSPKTHYRWANDGRWWDGYHGQEIVIINEFRGQHQIQFGDLMDIVDRHPYEVCRRSKDPHPLLAKKVIITSSKHPYDIYNKEIMGGENFEQFSRRFRLIEHKKIGGEVVRVITEPNHNLKEYLKTYWELNNELDP